MKRGSDFGSIRVRPPLVQSGQRVGVMGGSFNPPHEGHRIVAETALKRLGLDQLWWLATPGNPLKFHGQLMPLAKRLDLIGRFATNPRMKITSFEAELNTPYTASTLDFLERRYPDVHFVWVMGADNLAGFHRWQRWRSIADTMPIAVVDRPRWRFRALTSLASMAIGPARLPESQAKLLPFCSPPAWVFLTTRLSSKSSTEIRERA